MQIQLSENTAMRVIIYQTFSLIFAFLFLLLLNKQNMLSNCFSMCRLDGLK